MKSLAGLLLAAIGGMGPLLPAFLPQLGIGTLARLGKVNPLRRMLGLLGWLLIWRSWRQAPSLRRGALLLPGTIFALQANFLEPRRLFVDLVDPPHRTAPQAQLANTAVSIEPPNPPKGLLSFAQLELLLEKFTGSYKTPGLNHNDTRLPSHEEVGGLLLNGQARAYPLTCLHETTQIRDTLGGVPITVLYDAQNDRLYACRQTENGRPDTNHPLSIQRQFWLGWSEFHPHTTIFNHSEQG